MVLVLLLFDKTVLKRHCTHQSFGRSQLSCILCIFLDDMHKERPFPPSLIPSLFSPFPLIRSSSSLPSPLPSLPHLFPSFSFLTLTAPHSPFSPHSPPFCHHLPRSLSLPSPHSPFPPFKPFPLIDPRSSSSSLTHLLPTITPSFSPHSSDPFPRVTPFPPHTPPFFPHLLHFPFPLTRSFPSLTPFLPSLTPFPLTPF